MKKQKRWMKSVIAASKEAQPALPFGRGRARPASFTKSASLKMARSA